MSARPVAKVRRDCGWCGANFEAYPHRVEAGKARYCSRSCAGHAGGAIRAASHDQVAKFWQRVDRRGGPDACWPWTWRFDEDGYGRFHIGSRARPAHAVSLELAVGPPPPERPLALHSCDNRPCCNPAHLRWGTQQDNVADRVARQRSRGHGAKINLPEMLRLRRTGWTVADLAGRYGANESSVYRAIRKAERRA